MFGEISFNDSLYLTAWLWLDLIQCPMEARNNVVHSPNTGADWNWLSRNDSNFQFISDGNFLYPTTEFDPRARAKSTTEAGNGQGRRASTIPFLVRSTKLIWNVVRLTVIVVNNSEGIRMQVAEELSRYYCWVLSDELQIPQIVLFRELLMVNRGGADLTLIRARRNVANNVNLSRLWRCPCPYPHPYPCASVRLYFWRLKWEEFGKKINEWVRTLKANRIYGRNDLRGGKENRKIAYFCNQFYVTYSDSILFPRRSTPFWSVKSIWRAPIFRPLHSVCVCARVRACHLWRLNYSLEDRDALLKTSFDNTWTHKCFHRKRCYFCPSKFSARFFEYMHVHRIRCNVRTWDFSSMTLEIDLFENSALRMTTHQTCNHFKYTTKKETGFFFGSRHRNISLSSFVCGFIPWFLCSARVFVPDNSQKEILLE